MTCKKACRMNRIEPLFAVHTKETTFLELIVTNQQVQKKPTLSLYKKEFQNRKWPHRLVWPRTPDFHSDNRGSNPLGVKITLCYKTFYYAGFAGIEKMIKSKNKDFISKKALFESLAQRLEHLTFNEGVDGSNPSRLTFLSHIKEYFHYATHFLNHFFCTTSSLYCLLHLVKDSCFLRASHQGVFL